EEVDQGSALGDGNGVAQKLRVTGVESLGHQSALAQKQQASGRVVPAWGREHNARGVGQNAANSGAIEGGHIDALILRCRSATIQIKKVLSVGKEHREA